MSESIILNNILGVLKPYLTLRANELIFNRPCEINIDYGDRWEIVQDPKLDIKFLNNFLIELATRRNQRFRRNRIATSHANCPIRFYVTASKRSINQVCLIAISQFV